MNIKYKLSNHHHHYLLTNGPGVGRDGRSGGRITIAHDQYVMHSIITRSEWVLEDATGTQYDLAVIAGRLSGRTAIEVPFGQCIDAARAVARCYRERTRLRSTLALGIDPNVLGEEFIGGVGQRVEPRYDVRIELRPAGSYFEVIRHAQGGGRRRTITIVASDGRKCRCCANGGRE